MYEFRGVVGTRDQEPEDLDVHLIWRYFGYDVKREDLEKYIEVVEVHWQTAVAAKV